MFRVFSQLLIVVLTVCILQTVNARSFDDVSKSGYMEIAVYNNFPPYSYKNDQGEPTGIDIQIGKEIASALKVEPKWFWLDADENVEDDLRNAIWKGRKMNKTKADLMLRVPYDRKFAYAIDGYGLPRNDMVVMFSPYHAESWMIARNLEKTGESRNLAVFRFQKVGVEIDSMPDFYLLSAYRGSIRDNVTHYNNMSAAIDGLVHGEVAGVIGMQSQVQWALGPKGHDKAGNYDLSVDGLEQMSGKKQWDIGMAVRHDFRQLSHEIEAVVEKMVKSGRIEQIFSDFGVNYLMPEYHQ